MEQGSILPYPERGGGKLAAGTVRMAGDGLFVVETPGRLTQFRKAESCLIRPEIGDSVLVYRDSDEDGYILAVLVRAAESPATIGFERGVSLEAGAGAFAVEAPEIRLEADRRVSLTGGEFSVEAKKGVVAVETLAVRGRTLTAVWEQARTTVRYLDEICERVVQKVSRCYRTVAEFEESRLGRLRMLVGGRFSLRSKQASMIAEETVTIDGKQIHLG
ncbi:MAG: DUF3540 domain-containing protein [Candidatus Latescibacterota bacterium]